MPILNLEYQLKIFQSLLILPLLRHLFYFLCWVLHIKLLHFYFLCLNIIKIDYKIIFIKLINNA